MEEGVAHFQAWMLTRAALFPFSFISCIISFMARGICLAMRLDGLTLAGVNMRTRAINNRAHLSFLAKD